MERSEARKTVVEILVELLGIAENDAVDSAHIVEDLGADSLDVVEIGMMVEEAFGLEIPDDEGEKLTTVGSLVDYVSAHVR